MAQLDHRGTDAPGHQKGRKVSPALREAVNFPHVPTITDPGFAAKKPATDWEAIEREYRAGQLSEAQIARQFDISRAAIQKKAKRLGWKRDLTDKVRAEVAARLVAEGLQGPRDAATIEQAADRAVKLVLSHRVDIGQTRGAVTRLIEELHDTLSNLDQIEEDIIAETEAPDGIAESKAEEQARFKRRARMQAAIALPSRATVVNTLTSALKTLIPLERQAFNLQDGSGDNPDEPRKALTADMTPQEAAEAYHDKLRRLGSG